jgi:predicted oxidoreductase
VRYIISYSSTFFVTLGTRQKLEQLYTDLSRLKNRLVMATVRLNQKLKAVFMTQSTSSAPIMRNLGKTDIKVSALGWGMWRFVGIDVLAARALVDAAFEAGINFFDTADIYGFNGSGGFGDAEALLGQVFETNKSLREKMVLASKGGIIPPMPYNSTTNYLVEACEASLRRLKTDVIDLWQIHRPDLLAHPHEMAAAFDKMKSQGKVRAFGVSNFTVAQTRALQAHLDFPLASYQPEFSPLALDTLMDGTLDLAIELGASVLAWSPLGGGRIAKPETDPRATRVADVLDQVAAKHGVSRSTIAYAWVMMHPSAPIPLVGSQNVSRILETRDVAKVNLSRDDWYTILVASRGVPMP